MKVRIYIEGGGDSKELHARCREGFSKLIEKCGMTGKMPQLIACGSRNETYDDFKNAHSNCRAGEFIAMVVDSEALMANIELTWQHLNARDNWQTPEAATDDQVLMMTTCMETWIVADRVSLGKHFDQHLQEKALPALHQLEARTREEVQQKLDLATRNCKNKYQKGKRSFEILAKLDPDVLTQHLPSFVRFYRILNEKCG